MRNASKIKNPEYSGFFLIFIKYELSILPLNGTSHRFCFRCRNWLVSKHRINSIISKHTGRPVEQVEKDTDRDYFMTPEEAKAYGLVDEVVQSRKEIPGLDKKE